MFDCTFLLSGAVRERGDEEYPGIYVRLDHPSVLFFITSIVWPPYGMTINY
jgi:hypothetical protein